jgi:hemerythrin-like domain-containing protein
MNTPLPPSASESLPGVRSPAAGFDEPFAMLDACHERVRRTLALLERLRQYLLVHENDNDARDAARDVLRYFAMAAPAHHEDEERHVVPLLRQSGEERLVQAAQRILEDHAEIRSSWCDLEPMLVGVVAGIVPDARSLAEAVARFARVHDGHLALEDDVAFPAAFQFQVLKGAEALADMGREMARRRMVGVDPARQ